MICPQCKCEYVAGIKICPDCKVELKPSLVEKPDFLKSLDEDITALDESGEELTEDVEEAIENGQIDPLAGPIPNEEMIKAILERRRMIEEIPVYTAKSTSLANNRSGASALLLCGVIGCTALVLNLCGVIKLPIGGSSMVMTSIIMGTLFLAFLISGILCLLKVVKLSPEVEKEKELSDRILQYIKENRGKYRTDPGLSPEEAYLEKSAAAVKDIEAEFPDLEPGFAYYVVDELAGDLLDED